MAATLTPVRGDLSGSSARLTGNACALACCEFLAARANSARLFDVFRVAVTAAEVTSLTEVLAGPAGLGALAKVDNPHLVATLLLMQLRGRREPLVTRGAYEQLLRVGESQLAVAGTTDGRRAIPEGTRPPQQPPPPTAHRSHPFTHLALFLFLFLFFFSLSL
jgi:hypothetical protein